MRTAVYCGTRNLYHHMAVAARSLIYHNGADKVYLVIEDDAFPEELPPCVASWNVSAQPWFHANGPNMKSMWTYMALMRVALTKYLSDNRILSMDVDTIVCDDISPLWELDMTDAYFAAVPETIRFTRENRPQPYYNFGVAMLNLDLMRRHRIDDTLIQTLNVKWIQFPEQDALNSVCRGHIITLPEEYNSAIVTGPHNPDVPVRIKHFAARHPWNTTPEYLKYENMTWEEAIKGKEIRT